MNDAGHAAFVLLAWPVDVEVAQADHGAFELGHMAPDVVVEDQFGVAVDVERALIGGMFLEFGAGSVDGSGGGIDQWNLVIESEVQQLFGVGKVVVHHVAPIIFEGVGTGALVEDGANLEVVEVTCFEGGTELALVHVIGKLGTGKVKEFGSGQIGSWGEVVDEQDVVDARVVELLNKVAADETCAASDDNHLKSS